MGNENKYEPPKEYQINEYLTKKQKIIDNHIANGTQPTSTEIKLVSKYDIDIFEFLTRNIDNCENQIKKTKTEKIKKRAESKLAHYKDLKDQFERLNWQWEELLGYHEQEKQFIAENKQFIKENIDKNKLREGVVFVEEEEEEEESDSDDYYCNSKFYEKNPNKVGENNDKYKFYTESVKDDDYDKSKDIVIPYGMD